MASEIRFEVDDSGVRGVIEALQQRLMPNQLQEFLIAHAHPELKQSAEERFANEGDDIVGAWAELTRTTGLVRSWLGYPPFHPINVRSGALKNFVLNTFTTRVSGGAGAVLMMPGPASGELLSKFRVAQQGGAGLGGVTRSGFGRGSASATHGESGPNRPTPPRPVLAIGQRDSLEISLQLLDWLRVGIF